MISTGQSHSVRDFAELAFKIVGKKYTDYVVTDPQLYRPAEVNILCGDSSVAQKKLGWKPQIAFEDLVREMVVADCKLLGVEV